MYGPVQRWRRQREAANDLRVLTRTTVEELRAITNSGKIRGRYKAEVVSDAAAALVYAKIVTAADLQTCEPAARAAYLSVSGCGPVTWRYLRMLIGSDDVKPDTWVMRFVRDKLPEIIDPDDAAALITAVAGRMGVDARDLDHAIWRYRRANPGAPTAAPAPPQWAVDLEPTLGSGRPGGIARRRSRRHLEGSHPHALAAAGATDCSHGHPAAQSSMRRVEQSFAG